MLPDPDCILEESQEIPNSGKSRLAGILRTFSGSAHDPRRCKKLTISKPHMDLPYGKTPVSPGQSLIFLDVLQDYLPHEPDNERKRRTPMASYNSNKHSKNIGAEVQRFLNVHKGEVVQLLNVASNNLVEVRLVNRVGRGLVPARCVAVNSSLTPSRISSTFGPQNSPVSTPTTVQSLTPVLASRTSKNGVAGFTEQLPSPPMTPAADAFLPDIETCQVEAIDLWDNRVWYKIRCVMKTGHHRVLSRFYQDFYSLQLLIRDQLVSEGHTDVQDLLPGLPSPCRSVNTCQISSRLQDFNRYLDEIVQSAIISEENKKNIVQDHWLSPKAGDIVVTPRGSTFKLSPSPSGTDSWETVACKAYSEDSTILPSPIPARAVPVRLNPGKGVHNRSSSFTAIKNAPECPITKRQVHSAPTTPLLSYAEMNDSPSREKDIKVKILYDGECFVAKCSPSEVQSYQQVNRLCHAKLTGYLPDASFPLMISYINDKQESVVLTEESFGTSLTGSRISNLAARNMTCSSLRKLVLRVTT
ncbi:LAME_0H10528g1_1 [Lachancea meyersii CBS 8951]|uniref:LAME_0H10528g1_1 n=1 Tax=Lachancea meyersii CBS 8951 TaxID=1266667 RepID=A0A1G4KG08_9SACH|nr:LAME_0H10528g1_1 [Lachancea meyersii CBS 8951]